MNQDIESVLKGRLGQKNIQDVVEWASENLSHKKQLLYLSFNGDEKVSSNALWCMTHLRKNDSQWLQSLQNNLIDSLLKEKNIARKRMLLQLLRNQEYTGEDIRVDFLDFCMANINSETEPYAIRCFSLYIAIKMCRYYKELISELQERITLLSREPLSPGFRCAIRKVQKEIESIPNK